MFVINLFLTAEREMKHFDFGKSSLGQVLTTRVQVMASFFHLLLDLFCAEQMIYLLDKAIFRPQVLINGNGN